MFNISRCNINWSNISGCYCSECIINVSKIIGYSSSVVIVVVKIVGVSLLGITLMGKVRGALILLYEI